MKTVRSSIASFSKFGLTFLATMVAASALAQAVEKSVKVIRVSGGARAQVAGGTWQEIKQGDVLGSGAVIQTAKDSTLDLLLSGEVRPAATRPLAVSGGGGDNFPTPSFPGRPTASVIRLYGDTVLAIDRLTSQGEGPDQVTETLLDLRAGKLFGSTQKVKGASKYEIKLPNGVAAIRGTIYTVGSDGTIAVMSGSVFVTVRNPDGSTVTQQVPAGFSFSPTSGTVSPVSSSQAMSMMAAAADSGREVFNTPTMFTADGTTSIWVSPTAGTAPGTAPSE